MCDSDIYASCFSTQGRIQFFIDALDGAAQINETEVLIDRFPIDLELVLGAAFTERTTYTGIYNIASLGFDMSFRVQCSESYYDPNCATFCAPMDDLYICDSEGRIACIHNGQNPATRCTTCISSFYDPHTNCTQCLTGRDVSTNCTECLVPGYDPSTNCMECLPNMQCQSIQPRTVTATTQTATAATSSTLS